MIPIEERSNNRNKATKIRVFQLKLSEEQVIHNMFNKDLLT